MSAGTNTGSDAAHSERVVRYPAADAAHEAITIGVSMSLTGALGLLAARQVPRPRTVAFVSADAEFARNPIIGAAENAKKYGFTVVDERTYPLSTNEFTPIIDSVAGQDPDLLVLCSYLDDSIGLVRALRGSGWAPKMVGGAMIGPQSTAVKSALGPPPERSGELRVLAPRTKHDVHRCAGAHEHLPATSTSRERGSDRFLHGTPGVRADAGHRIKHSYTQVVVAPAEYTSGEFRYPYSAGFAE